MTNLEIKTMKEDYPILSKLDAWELFHLYQKKDPEYLASRIYKHNIRLYLKQHQSYLAVPLDEFLSLCWESAFKVAQTRDENCSYGLSTSLVYGIRRRMQDYNRVGSLKFTSLDGQLAEDFTLADTLVDESYKDYDDTYDYVVSLMKDNLKDKDFTLMMMYKDGKTFVEIGEVLGLTKQAISHKFKVLCKKVSKLYVG
jgi:hypothetical protein